MIEITDETADAAMELLSTYIPTIQSEHRDVIERVMQQIENRECDEADLTFALCLLQDITAEKEKNVAISKQAMALIKTVDKEVILERELINCFYAILMQQSPVETRGVALWGFKRQPYKEVFYLKTDRRKLILKR